MPKSAQTRKLLEGVADALLPPRTLTVSQWADENRMLSSEASADRGKWTCWPFQREPMDCLGPDDPCTRLVLMCAAQMLKTELMLNMIGYVADVDPGPILCVLHRESDAETFSKDRLGPMIRDTPCLRGKFVAAKSRDAGNTTLYKRFAGGQITMVGSITESSLSSRPIRYLLCDEIDRYPSSAGKGGDPISLAEKRTSNFWNRKIILASTPSLDGESRIQKAWEQSDQRSWFVPCPHCGHYQKLIWGRVRWGAITATWDGGAAPRAVELPPRAAVYQCEGCETLIPEARKHLMEDRGKWIAANPTSPIPGFHLPAVHSMARAWGDLAEEWVAAKDDHAQLKVFINTVLAEPWVQPGASLDWEKIYLRHDDYPIGIVPEGGLLLVAGVDVQDTRFEVEIKAYGTGRESWSVQYLVIQAAGADGRPLSTLSIEPWRELEAVLARDWPCADGRTMPIMAMAIDSGFRPQMVYDFAARHPQPAHGPSGDRIYAVRTVIPTKGKDTFERLIASVSNTDAAAGRGGLRIWHIGTHFFKQEFYDALKSVDPETRGGPGYHHYSYTDKEFYRGLVSEKRVERANGKIEWVPERGIRNEPLDLHGECRLAAAVCGVDRWTDDEWAALAPRRADPLPTAAPKPKPNPADDYWGGPPKGKWF